MDKLKWFRKELSEFEYPQIKRLATLMIENADLSFFTLPYSSTGRYMSYFSRGEGGLARHTKAVFYMARNYRTPLILMGDMTKKEGELMMLAALCHGMGAWKRKLSVNDGKPEGHEVVTRKMLPPYAVEYLMEMYSKYKDDLDALTNKDMEYVSRLILCQLGPWGDDKPVTHVEKLFSMAVYCSTLSKFELKIFTHWNRTAVEQLIDNLGDIRFHVGKYKGSRLSYVYKRDKDYMEWFQKKADVKYYLLKKAIELYVEKKKNSEDDEW